MLDVVKIMLDFYLGLFDVGSISLCDLCPAGDVRFNDVAVVVKGDFLQHQLPNHLEPEQILPSET
ncbi:hypothetical protein [Snodgrassella alvi]|uniref:hypothetical protein n=1 Tax=Snodgrassella alvi TaxID=1196083 RepID=UPI00346290BE